jgi:hypothetical protein
MLDIPFFFLYNVVVNLNKDNDGYEKRVRANEYVC